VGCPSCGESNGAEALYCGACGVRLRPACGACGAEHPPGQQFCARCGTRLTDGSRAPGGDTFAGGRYRVQRLLGEGAKKRVYLATDTRLEREVALAVVKTEGLDATGRARIEREARAMARLGDHPHVVTVFDVGEERGQPYIVSQYLASGSVAGLLERADHRRLPVAQAIRIGVDVCRALEQVHARGVLHRDLKPSNVWLAADGTAKLGDFGLALAGDGARLTAEGMMVGTVAYISPEQALGRPLDTRGDLYAFGAMLYELVAGRPPFVGDDAVAVVSQHLNTAPVAPSWHNPEVPKALEALILRLLAKAAEDRPSSAGEVREALEAVAKAPAESAAAVGRGANPLDRLSGGVFVGRAREIEELRAVVEDVRAGHGHLVLLVGEPGIGKTRTASEITTYARLRGCQVLWGRAVETGGAPAYWPWVQVIRAYLHEREPQHAIAEMGSGAADIAQVVSEVRERLPAPPAVPVMETEQARFRLFDSVATFLRNAATRRPLVVVLDDLHWADEPSLLLLQFLAHEMATARLLVVGTYRDVALGREHPLFQALGELAREIITRRFELRGLTEPDVARYIEMTAGTTPAPALVTALHRETEGNPFFLGEVVRLLVTEGTLGGAGERNDRKFNVPQGVREVIARRLDSLSRECNELLGVAAVIGREFGANVLEQVTNLPRARVLELVEEAVASRIVAEVSRVPGRYGFTHALIRETLYADLPASRRMDLHRRIGGTLERLYAVDLDRHTAELAYHFGEALESGGDAEKAIGYALRAGARAMRQLAYEDAAAHYERGLEAVDLAESPDVPAQLELLLGLGEAKRKAAEVDAAKTVFRQAADIARRLGASDQLARAALAYAGPTDEIVSGKMDQAVVDLFEEAAAALGEEDSPLRAQVLVRLAAELFNYADPERSHVLVRDGLAMARRIGDPAALAFSLIGAHFALWWPDTLDERLTIATETIRMAQQLGDKELEFRGRVWAAIDFLELNDIPRVDAEMDACSRLAAGLRQRACAWYVHVFASTRAVMAGRLEEAEREALEAVACGVDPAMRDHAASIQLFYVRREQGRFDEVEPGLRITADQSPLVPAWHSALAVIYAESGQEAETRREFEWFVANGFARRDDSNRMITLVCLAEACGFLGDAERAEILYDKLLPYAARNMVIGNAFGCTGSIEQQLGLLATTMRRWDAAVGHFEAALAANVRGGATCAVVRTQRHYAHMLLARGEPGDRERALELVTACLETADRIGMQSIAERALALKRRAEEPAPASIDAVVFDAPPTRRPAVLAAGVQHVFRCEGDFWTLEYAGKVCRLRDAKGLHHIAHLLRHPDQSFEARTLVGAPEEGARGSEGHELSIGGLGDAGTVLDAQAKGAYRERLAELREDLEEAERFNDPGRAGRAREEIDFLTGQLASAVGLGGRDRKVGSAAERARLTVTKRIKDALGRIRETHPALGDYLAGRIKTGYLCAYNPEPNRQISWEV